jgi:hypothetical protein
MSRMRNKLLSPILALLLIAAAAGVAGAQNTVTGTFTVKGTATTFTYAYAYWKTSVFSPKPDLFVLFSDIAIPPDAIPKDDDGIGKIAGLVRDGKVHAVELHLAPGNKQLDPGEQIAVYHAGLAPARHGMSGMNVFDLKASTAAALEGTAHTDGPQKSDGVAWQYEVTFKVAIPPQGKGR